VLKVELNDGTIHTGIMISGTRPCVHDPRLPTNTDNCGCKEEPYFLLHVEMDDKESRVVQISGWDIVEIREIPDVQEDVQNPGHEETAQEMETVTCSNCGKEYEFPKFILQLSGGSFGCPVCGALHAPGNLHLSGKGRGVA
jgi:hypothetical protein